MCARICTHREILNILCYRYFIFLVGLKTETRSYMCTYVHICHVYICVYMYVYSSPCVCRQTKTHVYKQYTCIYKLHVYKQFNVCICVIQFIYVHHVVFVYVMYIYVHKGTYMYKGSKRGLHMTFGGPRTTRAFEWYVLVQVEPRL